MDKGASVVGLAVEEATPHSSKHREILRPQGGAVAGEPWTEELPDLGTRDEGWSSLFVPVDRDSAHSQTGLPRQVDARLGGDKLILAGAAPDS